jgi:hypothetical protein
MSRTIDEHKLPNFEENESPYALGRGEDGITMRRNRSRETKRASDKAETKFNSTDKAPMSTIIKPATFDGSGSWLDYKSHFEACSELNKWTNKQKGFYLVVSLRGQAQGIPGDLSGDITHEY